MADVFLPTKVNAKGIIPHVIHVTLVQIDHDVVISQSDVTSKKQLTLVLKDQSPMTPQSDVARDLFCVTLFVGPKGTVCLAQSCDA